LVAVGCLGVGVASTHAQQPISYFPFDGTLVNEASARDTSGLEAPDGIFRQGVDAATAVEADPRYVLGVDGTRHGALLLDGLHEWVDLSLRGQPGATVPAGSFSGPGIVSGSILAWVRVPTLATNSPRYLIGADNAAENDHQAFRFGWDGSTLASVVHGAPATGELLINDATGDLSWADGGWHHLALTWDAVINRGRVFVDGVQVGDDSTGGTLSFATAQNPWDVVMSLGARNHGGILEGFWRGAIDEFQIFAEELTPIQVESQFAAITPPQTPDFDGDEDVDGSDFLIWQRGFGAAGDLSLGDASGNGQVDEVDYLIWESRWGRQPIEPPGMVGAAVPEPGTAVLGWLAMVLGVAPIRVRRSVRR
jgi:hypothetical protein